MKRALLMIALILASVFLGSMIGELTLGVESLAWLGKSYEIGISTFDLNLKLMTLTFGCHFQVCIAEVLLVLISLLAFPKLSSLFFS
ncbi:MAG: DUF4321 domain-containing protein [Oscillospiraceae bacterium]|nr:DUF4321 domain-containing protein [Oscillospiraceae bacterium]